MQTWILTPTPVIKQPMELCCARDVVLNGIHGNLTNNAKIHRPNGIEQAIELLNDLQLNNHSPTQHPQERVATRLKTHPALKGEAYRSLVIFNELLSLWYEGSLILIRE